MPSIASTKGLFARCRPLRLWFGLLTLAAALTTMNADGAALVIGKVSDNPKKHYGVLKPMVDYVAGKMTDLGIDEGKVVMAKDNQQMARWLRQGKVDWVTETAFSSVYFRERVGAEILLRKWKKGVSEYHTVFFARRDSGIRTLDDLLGRTIAFEDPGSTSAYFVPSSILLKRNMPLMQLDSPLERPPGDAIGFVFSGEEVNTSTWVHKGLVDVGAFNNLDWNKEDHLPSAYRRDLVVIHRSKRFPRALELTRGDLAPEIKERLKRILLRAEHDPAAIDALHAYQRTTRFDDVSKATHTALEEISSLLKVVQVALR